MRRVPVPLLPLPLERCIVEGARVPPPLRKPPALGKRLGWELSKVPGPLRHPRPLLRPGPLASSRPVRGARPETSMVFAPGEKSGNEQEEVALQNASKQIVQTAILQAVQQVSRESQQKEKRVNSSVSLQLERGELTKKHEKK
uniref:A-kinase anchor inhibitor 1 n=1 Tax=Chrysemys picta bellii TaxID=8478 RepID=A0A8C3H8L4_CHRPI|nr:A-kinase anchor protein inhibitor 1 [Chrysemys picta bellii]